jgi:hypothetical protein
VVGVDDVGKDGILVGHGDLGGLAVIVHFVLGSDSDAAQTGNRASPHLGQK